MYLVNVATITEQQEFLGAPSRFAVAKVVLEQVETFYDQANIPMVTERRACEKIIKLLNDKNKLCSIDKSKCDLPVAIQKLQKMQFMLATIF